jgi:transposase
MPAGLLKLLHRWRSEAIRTGREIERIVVAYEAGRDGFWLARWLRARNFEAFVIHPSSVAAPRTIGPFRRLVNCRKCRELSLRSILQVRADQDALPRRTADEAKDPASIATLGEFCPRSQQLVHVSQPPKASHRWLGREQPQRVTRWVVMDAALPGIGPRDEIIRSPALCIFPFRVAQLRDARARGGKLANIDVSRGPS